MRLRGLLVDLAPKPKETLPIPAEEAAFLKALYPREFDKPGVRRPEGATRAAPAGRRRHRRGRRPRALRFIPPSGDGAGSRCRRCRRERVRRGSVHLPRPAGPRRSGPAGRQGGAFRDVGGSAHPHGAARRRRGARAGAARPARGHERGHDDVSAQPERAQRHHDQRHDRLDQRAGGPASGPPTAPAHVPHAPDRQSRELQRPLRRRRTASRSRFSPTTYGGRRTRCDAPARLRPPRLHPDTQFEHRGTTETPFPTPTATTSSNCGR